MKLHNLFISFVFGLSFVSVKANAAQSCMDLFNKSESQGLRIMDDDAAGLNTLETHLTSLENAKSTRRANEAMDALMAQANLLLDNVVNHILMAKMGGAPAPIAAALFESSTFVVSHLSNRFQIPINALEDAVVIRINEELRQYEAMTSAEKNRAPTIGFGKRAVATPDSPTEFNIGFETIPKNRKAQQENAASVPMGFDLGQSKRAATNPEDGVARKKISLELPDRASGDTPMGFQHFSGKDVEHYLLLNHRTGYFEVHFREEQPMGFLLRPQ